MPQVVMILFVIPGALMLIPCLICFFDPDYGEKPDKKWLIWPCIWVLLLTWFIFSACTMTKSVYSDDTYNVYEMRENGKITQTYAQKDGIIVNLSEKINGYIPGLKKVRVIEYQYWSLGIHWLGSNTEYNYEKENLQLESTATSSS